LNERNKMIEVTKTASMNVKVTVTLEDIHRALPNAGSLDKLSLLFKLCDSITEKDVSELMDSGATKHGLDSLKCLMTGIVEWIDDAQSPV